MTVKTRTSRTTWVWGDKAKGIAVVRSARKQGGKYWYDIHHMKNGKINLVHRDYPTKTEAMKEARSYAKYERAHPRSGFLK